jgi:hypothetical protein
LVPAVTDQETGELFRFACLLWSVPVSRGYGRRMRFLVRDRSNGRLIGLFALNDPVFNLRARDEWIGWNVNDRRSRLVNVLDAYAVGAVPPYSQLLGGKLVAALMGSAEVCADFARRYAKSVGRISQEHKHPKLLLITVTSALGRSSLYNRLRLVDHSSDAPTNRTLVEMIHIGFTKGYGHFQISDPLFQRMRSLLAMEGHPYANAHAYGQGPNWRIRVMRVGLDRLGLDDDLIRHGINREIYAMPLAEGFRDFLCGRAKTTDVERPSVAQLTAAALERWVVPRATRQPAYRAFRREEILEMILPPASIGK